MHVRAYIPSVSHDPAVRTSQPFHNKSDVSVTTQPPSLVKDSTICHYCLLFLRSLVHA